ncbi:MAG: hypothetical protein JST22_09770 [Bacteroidetes bacterium]|nr:hypothetical protein [Bacteroidota bacterium]
MSTKRVDLYGRLPEIYRIKDAEAVPPDQLKSYLAIVEDALGAIHGNVEELYHDLFIETANHWVVPYIGDLLGTSHLTGDPWTLRADVADTIALRRRKGTLGAIELLAYNLTRWGVHCVELLELLAWNQHLNHQRPAEDWPQPYRETNRALRRQTPIRGGTVTLRDPATLSLLGTPFDRFAHLPDLRSPLEGGIHYNLPNVAVFLWRLETHRVQAARPVWRGTNPVTGGTANAVRFNVNPIRAPYSMGEALGRPVRLFNTAHTGLLYGNAGRVDPSDQSITITRLDESPGPIPVERLGETAATGAPQEYVAVDAYTIDGSGDILTVTDAQQALVLLLPLPEYADMLWPTPDGQAFSWTIRGENLCAWETGILPPLADGEIAIDPVRGRVVIGESDAARAAALKERLLITYTYGAVGPVGAHPISRDELPAQWPVPSMHPTVVRINSRNNRHALRDVLAGLDTATQPVVIEIEDSLTHVIDLNDPAYVNVSVNEDGGLNLVLGVSLAIRAADGERPVIRLHQPLRFRPTAIDGTPDSQRLVSSLTVRLEGLTIVRNKDYTAGDPLIARAALNRLEVIGCSLDPGGFVQFSGAVAPVETSMLLANGYGLSGAELYHFGQTPEIVLDRSVTGPLLIDSDFTLRMCESIIDGGQGVDDTNDSYALSAAGDPVNGWGPAACVDGVTFFGRTRVTTMNGSGGIWTHALQVLENTYGCIRYSYFSGESEDRLPQNHACVKGTDVRLQFTREHFGDAAYGQLARSCDFRIRERGPNDDAMGAFGFLLEAHKWRNLSVRFREFMPVGVRPLPIPVT